MADEDNEPDKVGFDDPNVLVDVEFNADEITLEFGELLKQYIAYEIHFF